MLPLYYLPLRHTMENSSDKNNEEIDTLIVTYTDGTQDTVELDPGTFAYLEKRAEKEGVPFNEAYLVKVLEDALDLYIKTHSTHKEN